MKRESIVYLISGTLFGVLVGWIIGSQQASGPAAPMAPAPASASASAPADPPPPPPLDTQRAASLKQAADAQPANAEVRVQLGDLYYDAQQFDLAAPWYEAALKLAPNNIDASTDLAVCYYSTNQIDRALAQIDHSLALNPKHTKTLLNQGVFRAFGKQDLAGAAESWQRVVDAAPESDDARRARQGLDSLKANHPGVGGRGGAPDAPPPAGDGR